MPRRRRASTPRSTTPQRLAVADVVIDTDGSMAHTMGQVDALWHRIKQERARA